MTENARDVLARAADLWGRSFSTSMVKPFTQLAEEQLAALDAAGLEVRQKPEPAKEQTIEELQAELGG